MTKPDDIPEWAWDEAVSITSQFLAKVGWQLEYARPVIARALLDAERRGMDIGFERAELACFHQRSRVPQCKETDWDRGNNSAVTGCAAAIRAAKDPT